MKNNNFDMLSHTEKGHGIHVKVFTSQLVDRL